MLQLRLLTDFMGEWDSIRFDNQILTDRSAQFNDLHVEEIVAKVEIDVPKVSNPESSWDQIYQILSMFPTAATIGHRAFNPALEACLIFIPHVVQEQAFINGLELNVGSGLGSDTDDLKFDKGMAADLLQQDMNHAKLHVNMEVEDVFFTRDMVRELQQRIFAKEYGYWNSPALQFKQRLAGGNIVSADLKSWWGRPEEL